MANRRRIKLTRPIPQNQVFLFSADKKPPLASTMNLRLLNPRAAELVAQVERVPLLCRGFARFPCAIGDVATDFGIFQ